MPLSKATPPDNRLLSSLPSHVRERFLASCETVELAFSEVISEPGDSIDHAYFPKDAFISLITKPTSGCPSLAVGLVGNEGMLGTALILGMRVSPLYALVQGAGESLRMGVVPFLRELQSNQVLRQTLKRYVYVVMGQLEQAAACTRFHIVEARLARWLLMTLDRAPGASFALTQEYLAHMLGVRRVGVSHAAASFQRRELIVYRRGEITILDRAGLEAMSCSCYETDNATYARIMGPSTVTAH